MVRSIVIVALLAGTAAAEPPPLPDNAPAITTSIVNDEGIGEIVAHGRWTFISAGLGVTHTLIGHLEASVNGSLMRLDASDMDDKRHGFAFHADGALGWRFRVSSLAGIDWGLEPQIGVGVAETYTSITASQHEVFAGLRGSFRFGFDREPADHFGQARGIGGHLTLRVSRAEQHFAACFLLGYDWGL